MEGKYKVNDIPVMIETIEKLKNQIRLHETNSLYLSNRNQYLQNLVNKLKIVII